VLASAQATLTEPVAVLSVLLLLLLLLWLLLQA
jgi:hypothetical protein